MRKMLLDWGRCHDLLDMLGVPDAPTLFERLRRMLSQFGRQPPKPKEKPQSEPEKAPKKPR